MRLTSSYLNAFIRLFYPKICVSCGQSLLTQEQIICTPCEAKLALTNFHKLTSNPLHKKFWGRIDIEFIDSLLFFEKDSSTQHLLHKLKYESRQDIGEKLAELVIERYASAQTPLPFQGIVSIPIHEKKLKRRGYNQCDTFAQTLSKHWNIPYYKNAVTRNADTKSQTGKNRIERWENVSQIFTLENADVLANKHILLIDDVITTGATLEACAIKVKQAPNTHVSILTMACKI